eukprot:CAMPEP_0197441576 /NCGR_PEP_ID=MMETSP1175-20131217/7819_1 /TAXON_ID=1003142 /ORGANISM="Triceratium dubium, Strain CCMP147" /LENGTH=563 /DNA_ID=CAMNT_0042971879 /DNA_START=60 /DNA_END=1751 /DNA_ORIENTATION=+
MAFSAIGRKSSGASRHLRFILARATKSTATPAAVTGASSCPFTGSRAEAKPPPKLNHAPKLPIVGSLPFFPPDEKDMYNYLNRRREKFGEWYSFGAPGFSNDIYGTVFVMDDPNEFVKVVRGEGTHPSGIVEYLWPIKAALKECHSALVTTNSDGTTNYGLFDHGEQWKKQRIFLQTGMLDPRTAKGFIPGISQAAELATAGAPDEGREGNLNHYLNTAAFDMFSSFMLGEFTQAAAGKADTSNDENIRFCNAAIRFMEMSMAEIARSPYEMVMKKLGIKTAQWKEMINHWKIVQEIGSLKLDRFIERRKRGELNDVEKASYFANALERFEAQPDGDENNLTLDEVKQLCILSLFVSVDTTSTVTSWNLVHLALNQDVQEKLYDEISAAVDNIGEGKLTASVLERSNTPYLTAFTRETNRLTPPFPSITSKSNSSKPIEIFGQVFPIGTNFVLENIGNDERFIPDAKTFRPERWFSEEVESRKGTKEESIDHVLARDPFGQGARRCPGSRVAANEVLCMISQLVLKYKVQVSSPDIKTLDDIEKNWAPFIAPAIPKLDFVSRE